MDDFRVPTTRLAVEILCADGESLQGDIFLPAHSSVQPGPMRPDEWSGSMPAFFPIRMLDAQAVTLVHRAAVVSMSVAAAANSAPDDACPDLPVVRVAVDAGGTRFEGDVTVDMPPGHQRVADWLNAPAAFFTVRAGVTHHLIQKRHVSRVVEVCRFSS